MVITRQIKEKLSSTPAGVVLTIRDFGVELQYQPALAKALSRLVLQGELQKIAKGKYYIPKKTIFGTLKPSDYGHENEMYKEPMNLKRGKGVYMRELRECGGRTEDKTKCAKG